MAYRLLEHRHPQPGTYIYNVMKGVVVGDFQSFVIGFHDRHQNWPFDLCDDRIVDTLRISCLTR
jgi:hypothetical protein